MALIVVGGSTRNIGKTSVVAGLIRALPERRWTAIKITQFGHGVCSANGEPCDCETAEHTIAISEERDSHSGTDTARFLEAGAERSLWVRTRQGQLLEAMSRIRAEIAKADDIIVESNSILRFVRPDLYLSVLDPATADFKDSARLFLDRADAILLCAGELGSPVWQGISLRLVQAATLLPIRPPSFVTEEIVSFVRTRLEKLGAAVPVRSEPSL